MTGRIVAIGFLVILAGLVAAFAIFASFGSREERPATAPNSAATIGDAPATGAPVRGKLGPWRLEGQLTLAASGAYELSLRVTDDGGEPAPASFLPTVRIDMVDHGMALGPARVDLDGPGRYRAKGTFQMMGRWRIRIGGAGDEFSFPVHFRR